MKNKFPFVFLSLNLLLLINITAVLLLNYNGFEKSEFLLIPAAAIVLICSVYSIVYSRNSLRRISRMNRNLESAAAAIENVASACALFDADKQEIVLFIETTAEIVARKFKMELKKYVPAYMVPGKIVTMEKFPHTPSGKIDRVGLRKTYITAE